MARIALFTSKPQAVDPELRATVALMSSLLKLQHYSPERSLQALTLAATKIEIDRNDLESLKLKASLRGSGSVRALTEAEGGQLSAQEVGAELGISRETVNQWRQEGRLLAWKRGARNFSYPAWQIHRGTLLRGLDAVLKNLTSAATEPLEVADFLLAESDELGGRPLDLLRKGAVQAVVEHAGRYGDIGA